MKKVISMIVAIAMLVTMFSTVINLGTAFAAQDYETVAFSYEDQASNANASNGGYSKSIPAGVLGWAKYGYDNAIAQMENAGITSFAPTSASTGFTVNFDSVAGKSGDTITVPINLVNVPSVGISTANMTIEYDATKLKYVSYEAGSIITNAATNFEINQPSDGTLKVLFLDYTMKTQAIKSDGVFASLKFEVISSATSSTTISVSKSTFGDNNMSGLAATVNNGAISLNGGNVVTTPSPTQTPVITATAVPTSVPTEFTAYIDSVAGKSGETITVPVNLAKVPTVGISTGDMTITYDSTKLEYVGYEAGSIVTNAATNLEINKESDGKLRVLSSLYYI
jgi:hypothetical protein